MFVYGDTHGCLDELRHLLLEAGVLDASAQTDSTSFPPLAPDCVVISVGDILNKGPLNLETLRFVRDMGILAVRGNHEDKVRIQLTKAQRKKTKQTQGKKAKKKQNEPKQDAQKEGRVSRFQGLMKPRYRYLEDCSDEDWKHLESLPYTISLPCLSSIVVHAGLLPGIPLHLQTRSDMTEMRNIITKQGGQLKGVQHRDAGVAWASIWPGPEHVYFGHDAKRGLQQEPFATGLDTGCVSGRTLTGVFLTGDKQIVQVQARKVYAD